MHVRSGRSVVDMERTLSDIASCFASHGIDAYGWFGFSTGMVFAIVVVVTPKFQVKWISRRGLDGFVGGIFVIVAMFTGQLLGAASKGLCHL
jgi:hypothetical protein